MKPLRVAHVVCSEGFAGVERYVLQSALSLREAGCDVTVVGGAVDTMGAPLREEGVGWAPALTVRQAYRALRGLGRVDVLDSHMTEADTAAVAAGLVGRIPVVSTRHFAAPRGADPVRRAVASLVGARVAHQIAISRFVAENVEGDSTVVHTGVPDVPDVDDAARERTVLVLQRLEAEKSTDVAVRAWAAAGRRDGWRLRIVGDGAERAALGELADRLGVADSVDFLGFRSDVAAQLVAASLVLAPTPREGLGLASLEAMAAGVPVVASRGGGHLETVGGVEGAALFSPGDAAAAGRLVAELIDDPARRRAYGAALRARQRDAFSVAAQTSATLRVLESAARHERLIPAGEEGTG